MARRSPYRLHAGIALAGVVGAGWAAVDAGAPPWVAALVAVNLVVAGAYAYDKAVARTGADVSRVPEAVLLGLAALGGSPGAFLASRALRHKTVKSSFVWKFRGVVALQALALGAWAWRVLARQ